MRKQRPLSWSAPSIAIILLMIAGVFGAFTDVLGPQLGFRVFVFGLLVAAMTTILLLALLVVGYLQRALWTGSAVRALIAPLFVVLLFLYPAAVGLQHPINDVTTDAEDRIGFDAEPLNARAVASRESTLKLQSDTYPHLKPLKLPISPDEGFRAARLVAGSMPRWRIIRSDPVRHRLEIRVVSAIFRFPDDVAVEVQATNEGCVVHMRSRSRIGQSDFGANAERIETFLQKMHEHLA